MSPPTPLWTLRGREQELAVLLRAVEAAAEGRQETVWLEGEAGIGKTRLLGEATAVAGDKGFRLAIGHADELERTRPFGAIADAFGCLLGAEDPRRSGVADLLSGRHEEGPGAVTVSSDPGLRFRLVDAFADLAAEWATAGPVLLAMDDLQWADASSVLALSAIRRRTVGLPLAVVGCFRPVPAGVPLRRLVDSTLDRPARHIAVAPLSYAAVRALVGEIVGAEPGARLLTEVGRAGGNALLVTELIGALARDSALCTVDGEVDIEAATGSPMLRAAVVRQLSDLPDASVRALRSASLLGARFSVTDLATVTGEPVTGLSAALTPALTAHVLWDDASGMRFRHELVHDAVYQDIPPSIRAALHRDAGRRLADAGGPARAVAAQFARAARPGDREAVEWLLRAAREAAPRSPDIAAELSGHALELMVPHDSRNDELAVERADWLMQAGNVADASAACRAVLDRRPRDPAAETDARLRLASALIVTGDPAQAVDQLGRIAGAETATAAQQASCASESATAHLWLGNLDRCEDLAHRAHDRATETGNDAALTGALATISVVAGLRAEFPRAIEVSDEALRHADYSSDQAGHQYPLHATRGFLFLEMDRFNSARRELDDGRRRCEELGVYWPLPTYQAYLGIGRFLCGDWDDALSELETSIELIEETGVSFTAGLVHSVVALVALHRNDLSGAARSMRAATPALERGPRHTGNRVRWAEALIREAGDDPGAAFPTLAATWEQCVRSGAVLDYPVLGPDVVRMSLDAGETGWAREVASMVERADPPPGVGSRAAAGLRCRGLIEDDPLLLAAAAHGYASANRPFEAAMAGRQAAVSFVRRGDTGRARPFFDAAGKTYHRLAARRELHRLDADLRAAAMPPGRRGPRRRPNRGWASLTETERAVADLVAEGLTNPQIGARLYVSRRTVQTHVSHIFRKLDLSSRAQLAGEVSRRRSDGRP
jgi:DNA-binding CsgD family transcriptional regulator/tetratricopeptide (TPR) repeat protein